MDDAILDEALGRSTLDARNGDALDIPAGGIPLDRDL
jgi:hypothetical protein